MSRVYECQVRRADGSTLDVEYTAKPGGYDSWYEPGDPPEFEVVRVTDVTGADVTDLFTPEEDEALHDRLCDEHDFGDLDGDYDYDY